jgi:hypothetical protein
MSGLVNVLVIGAVAVVVVVRQFQVRQSTDDRRWWVLPGVLLVIPLREPGDPVDPRRGVRSATVLGAKPVIRAALRGAAALMGAGRGTGPLLPALAAIPAARGGVPARRAGRVGPAYADPVVGVTPQPTWKDRV